MTRKRRRLYFVFLGLLGLGAGTALVLTAFQDNITFFRSPTEVAERHPPPSERMRIGGLIEAGSVKRDGDKIDFSVTDMTRSLNVHYVGILPDLFRECQGVVAEGHVDPDGVFVASEVVAKHDEKYMPREVADALKKSGRWQETAAKPGEASPCSAKSATAPGDTPTVTP